MVQEALKCNLNCPINHATEHECLITSSPSIKLKSVIRFHKFCFNSVYTVRSEFTQMSPYDISFDISLSPITQISLTSKMNHSPHSDNFLYLAFCLLFASGSSFVPQCQTDSLSRKLAASHKLLIIIKTQTLKTTSRRESHTSTFIHKTHPALSQSVLFFRNIYSTNSLPICKS